MLAWGTGPSILEPPTPPFSMSPECSTLDSGPKGYREDPRFKYHRPYFLIS